MWTRYLLALGDETKVELVVLNTLYILTGYFQLFS